MSARQARITQPVLSRAARAQPKTDGEDLADVTVESLFKKYARQSHVIGKCFDDIQDQAVQVPPPLMSASLTAPA